MSRYQITRRLEIDAGHRLKDHESKCKNVHGHRYVFLVTVASTELDGVGRVIDFGVIKQKLGDWLDEHWDHAFIYQQGDPVGDGIMRAGDRIYTVPFPPTAEKLAEYFHGIAEALLANDGMAVVNVRLYETPNCYADSRSAFE